MKFTASSREQVSVGDRFQLTYTVNENGTEFRGPDLKGFRVLSGPNMSTNRSYQIINGKMSQAVSATFTYYLQAIIEGEFTIRGATVYVDKLMYTSNKLVISVTKSKAPSTPAQATGSNTQNTKASGAGSQAGSEDDVFIKAFITKKNPYIGEQVIVTYKIYTMVPISQISVARMSSFSGFWSNDLLENNQKLNQYTEVYNGKEYIVADLKKLALFPQKTGELVLEPMELECIAQIRKQGAQRNRDPFFDNFFDDPFFNSFYQNVELSLKSNAIKLNIRPLPLENRPVNFSGAVGTYSLKSSIDKTELKANEAVNLKYTIAGKGNIELIKQFDLSFPPDIEAYDPKIINNIKTSAAGVSGTRTFEYLLIPRSAGIFNIESYDFTYFDLASKTFKRISTPAYTLSVEKGTGSSVGVTYSGVSQADIQYIGSDIRHIKTLPFQINKTGVFFFGSTTFFLWLIIPLFLFLILIIFWRRKTKIQGNAALVKNRKATKVARKNLRKANQFMKESNDVAFYNEVSRALWGYLGDKFNILFAELSMETVHDRLKDKSIKEETINEFIQTLDHCEFARFAPGDKSSSMNEIYTEALSIISRIERELKS
ncbi:MAG: BatD family protein [Bacteroidota bacterium]|nr:BatD family protein [Bacteroidota bacterium]